MAKNSVEGGQKLDVIKIPSIAFRSFINIAQQNQISGTLLQTMCYLLGPAQKTTNEEIWIDTVVLQKQTCTNIWVEDKGIEEKSTIEFLGNISSQRKKRNLPGFTPDLQARMTVNSAPLISTHNML